MKDFESNPNIRCSKDVIEIIQTGELFLQQKDRGQRQFQVLTGELQIPSHAIRNFNEGIYLAMDLKKSMVSRT